MVLKSSRELADEMADAVLNTAAVLLALGIVWALVFGGRK